MITHEEALNTLKNIMSSLVGTETNHIGNHFNADHLVKYFKQQEKVGELVFAYQNMFKEIQQLYYYAVYSNDNLTYYIKEIIEKHSEQIKQLESELGL